MLELRQLPQVKPKYARFKTTIKCPNCGDEKGHCGIFEDGESYYCVKCRTWGRIPGAVSSGPRIYRESPLTGEKARLIDLTWKKLIRNARPDRDETLRYLTEERKLPTDLANTMLDRGYSIIRRESSETTLKNEEQKLLKKHPALISVGTNKIKVKGLKGGLLIPLYNLFENGETLLIDFHKRMFDGETSKYIYLGSGRTDSYQRPSHTFVEGADKSKLIIVEGELKAEVASFYYGYDAVGLLGASGFNKVGEILNKLFECGRFYEEIYIAPDLDTYKKNTNIALAVAKAAIAIENLNVDVSFLVWHPLGSREKGIDNYLLSSSEKPLEVNFLDFLRGCSEPIQAEISRKFDKNETFKVLCDINSNLTVKMDQTFCNQMAANSISSTLSSSEEEEVRILRTFLFGESESIGCNNEGEFVFNDGEKVLVDCSSTGSGKTRKIAEYKEFLKGPAKRLVYISQSPLNPSVEGLKDFKKQIGRTPYGYVYDEILGKYRERTPLESEMNHPVASIEANCVNEFIRHLETQGHYGYVSKYCSDFCEHRFECPFRIDRDLLASKDYLSVSYNSYISLPGDLVIIDEFDSLVRYGTDTVNLDKLSEITTLYSKKDRQLLAILEEASKLTSLVTKKIKLKNGTTIYKKVAVEGAFHDESGRELVGIDWEKTMELSKEFVEAVKVILSGRHKHLAPQEFRDEVNSRLSERKWGYFRDFDPTRIVFSPRWRANGSEVLLRRIELVESLRHLFYCLNSLKGPSTSNSFIAGGFLRVMRKDERLSSLRLRLKEGSIKLLILDASAKKETYAELFNGIKLHFVKFGRDDENE